MDVSRREEGRRRVRRRGSLTEAGVGTTPALERFTITLQSRSFSRSLILPHFLRRTGIHFVGKCSKQISQKVATGFAIKTCDKTRS
ncbi:hypothetical protein [Methylobacterium sp. 17Sr1-1]|uniref:hypothetical protein n=1 Tax=Methylobacterium sp. 17Sr1-1 TaxID=2202826 RepID=UPI0013A5B3D1|nr:hypothetical protein [Methylobacterium sp. 17Sr1-1]